jgi:ribosomal-protein-alanine N-acetyltransferase
MSKETTYEIRVKGVLDSRWMSHFMPLLLVPQTDETLITGSIQDQSELFGVLWKIQDMGLQLISVSSSSFPILTTERLLLREFNLVDVPAVYDILGREEVCEWLETAPIQSLDEAETRVKSRMSLYRDKMGFRWAITLRKNPAQVIGSCGYFSVRRGTQTVETGYELHPDYWGKGIMSEALQTMIQFSFGSQDVFSVHRIEALVAPGNTASIRLLEKFGFAREGVRREFFNWKGCYQDVYLYALLNSK